MIRALKWFFIVLGVIFFCLLCVLGYFVVTDPFNLRPLLFGSDSSGLVEDVLHTASQSTSTDEGEASTAPTDSGTEGTVQLTPAQTSALETIGVDPATLPTTITPEQEACFVSILGQARVDQIIAGDTPTATEFFRAQSCL